MKLIFYILTFFVFFITQPFFGNPIKSTSTASADDSWKNFYGIAWRGTPADNIKYAKQMGHDYILIQKYYNKNNYIGNQNCAGLKFYVDDPQYWAIEAFGCPAVIDTNKTYTQAQIDFYNQNLAWKSNEPFPNNIATGWFYKDSSGNPTKFNAMLDFQQQAVINRIIEKIISIFHSYEDSKMPFTFGGYAIDVSKLNGDFNRWDSQASENVQVGLSYWTGANSSIRHDSITHEYDTYDKGMAEFYKQLNIRMRREFPNAKWIICPWHIYYERHDDEWVNQIKNRADKVELTPDMISQESPGTYFVDDQRNFNSGVNITKDMVGISQLSQIGESDNRLYAAKAGINGSWFNFFGNFGTNPNWQSITEVYPRLKIIRCIPNWDNLNNVPLADRSWDGSVYQSTKSYISSDVMYSRHPKTGKLFAVFNTTNGVIKLNADEVVTSVQNTDGYFIESGDASADFNINGNEIRLKSSVTIDVDSSRGQVKGKGYIFTLKSSGAPLVTTGSATSVTSNSATLTGIVNADGLSATVWFEYDTISGSYSSKSATQNVSGTSDVTVSIPISGLSPAKTYYFRIVAQSAAGTTNGAEMTLTTPDTTAPNCSISINNGDSYTKSPTVILTLSATDDIGVTGYYLSTSSTIPLATAAGWTSITSTASYNASIPYTLISGDGSKTLYVWYKDASGNISNPALDSIILDATAPAITITNPTYNPTYITTSSTMTLGGDVSDSISGICSITWNNNKGGSGSTNGTTGWVFSGITLSSGDNVITVTATDEASNTRMDTITVTYAGPPVVTTGGATNIISNSATLTGTVNADGLSATVWFEYDTISGSYSSKSVTQNVSGSSDVTVSIPISGLSPAKTYYFRIVAQSAAGTTSGAEMTLTTPDTTAPNCSISINNGDSYTKSPTVILTLSATDDIGVTGYYLSTSSTIPLATAAGWTSITSTASYTASIPHTLISGDGSKTLYVWYKDAAGNVSSVTSDSIILDTTVPLVTIISPTSNATYTTTSNTISLGGSALDDMSGVSSVTWSNSRGGSGIASGTTSWSLSDIGLSTGDNIITVSVNDGASNAGTAMITITVTTNVLMAYYAFDDGWGTIANDSSGNSNNGTLNGATWTTGKLKKALSYNGTSSCVIVPRMNYDDISISAWFFKNSNDTINADAVFGGWSWNSNAQLQEGLDLRFYQKTPNILDFIIVTKDVNGKRVVKNANYNLGNSVGIWYHVAGTYNSKTGEQKLFVNGTLVSTQTHPAGNVIVPLTSYSDMRIGYSRVNKGYFNGKIDDVRLYNQALSAQEIQNLYNQ
ncbi:MAG: hypothetical protein AYP45_14255 [Candidatus Brocadia carolinensis]|uniref:Fibronectin type-III domain-containing protein n=1 Tax=Candidatus Brocadia carolinensis TaxID=1004156 RepID=A0A1V4AQW8_9BACT|nr:MAG: hypothetical protein AYP45_14255 [Candidatus Brocadia caroliniensis]